MKTYVLMVSTVFPKGHCNEGFPTMFGMHIKNKDKIHTIRANYELWKKRFEKIDRGEACLSLRIWKGKPYQCKQLELMKLYKTDGIGIEKFEDPKNFVFASVNGKIVALELICKNDGFTEWDDFVSWFAKAKEKPMAIIHFTDFRYCN